MNMQIEANTFNFQHTRREGVFRTWFRGEHTNFNPDFEKMAEADSALSWVTQGWEPSERIVKPDTKITAFGSCFAANISNWLASRKRKRAS